MKWLAKQRFPAPMKSKPLADEDYYSFAMDGFASLSAKVGVLPCILDAAIFAENDGE